MSEPAASLEREELPSAAVFHGVKVTFDVPPSFAIRNEIAYSATTNAQRAYAAALGICWGDLQRRVRYRMDPLDYGGRVIDYLCGEGWEYLEVIGAGQLEYAHLTRGLFNEREVKDVENFTGPTGEK